MIEKTVGITLKCDVCQKVLASATEGFIVEGAVFNSTTDKAGIPQMALINSSLKVFPDGERKFVVLCRDHFLATLAITLP